MLLEEFYVDDGQGGENELDEAVFLKDNLIADLSKWKGNHPKLAQADSSKVKESDRLDDAVVKVLASMEPCCGSLRLLNRLVKFVSPGDDAETAGVGPEKLV